MRALLVSTFVLTVAAGTALLGSDWPSWRGPSNNGVSAETGLPVSWAASCADAPTAPAASADRQPGLRTDAIVRGSPPARPVGAEEGGPSRDGQHESRNE